MKILEKLFGNETVGAPVHAGANPVYFTDVYQEGDTWTFSWRSADHSEGETKGGFSSKASADGVRYLWAELKAKRQKAAFVHEGK